MIPWILLDKTTLSGSGEELRLYQHDKDFILKIGPYELMNSRAHNSEEELAKLACRRIKNLPEQNVLIGGLGMGFTLRAALNNLKNRTRITVAELVPAVISWNQSHLAHLAKNPLKDKRVSVYEGDVTDKIKAAQNFYHAVLLDVDNGAQGLTQHKNDSLYSQRGLKAIHTALQPKGILALWSAGPDPRFEQRLHKAGFKVETERVRARIGRKGGGHSVVWIATK